MFNFKNILIKDPDLNFTEFFVLQFIIKNANVNFANHDVEGLSKYIPMTISGGSDVLQEKKAEYQDGEHI